jgi:hypothetical protein
MFLSIGDCRDEDWGPPVKLLTEYIERALKMEVLAEGETDPKFKADLLKQAASYRQMAAKRAEQLGLPLPSAPEK